MPQLSRRNFIRTMSMGAAAGAALPFIPESVLAFEPPRARDAGAILLNSNENAYGPSPLIGEALRQSLEKANRYPDFQYDEFIGAVAKLHGVSHDQVLTGCGSTEILRIAAMAFAGSGHKLMTAVPTFEAIAHYSSSMGGQVVTFPLTANYAHDLAAMAARADSTTGLVYICNPNNPTGSLTPRREIEALLHKLPASTYVLVDEAYHHFVDSPEYVSFLDKPVNDPRVIVARTFSKVYGMAGIRAGYSISTVETAATLRRYQNADNLNVLAAHAAAVGLGDAEGTQQAVVRNARDRAEFMQQAGRRGLKSIPSQANFVMMDARRPAPGVIQDFRQRGILIGRPFPPMDNFVRISLGTPEQMTAFWRAWDQLPKVN